MDYSGRHARHTNVAALLLVQWNENAIEAEESLYIERMEPPQVRTVQPIAAKRRRGPGRRLALSGAILTMQHYLDIVILLWRRLL